MALAVTSDLFTEDDCANKILPILCSSLIDKEKYVSHASFNPSLNGLLTVLDSFAIKQTRRLMCTRNVFENTPVHSQKQYCLHRVPVLSMALYHVWVRPRTIPPGQAGQSRPSQTNSPLPVGRCNQSPTVIRPLPLTPDLPRYHLQQMQPSQHHPLQHQHPLSTARHSTNRPRLSSAERQPTSSSIPLKTKTTSSMQHGVIWTATPFSMHPRRLKPHRLHPLSMTVVSPISPAG